MPPGFRQRYLRKLEDNTDEAHLRLAASVEELQHGERIDGAVDEAKR